MPGRFAEGVEPLKLFPSRVGDGVCDCCDGADEWQSTHHNGADCADKCGAAVAKQEQEAKRFAGGAALRREYVTRGTELKRQTAYRDVDGGDEEAFLVRLCPLSPDPGRARLLTFCCCGAAPQGLANRCFETSTGTGLGHYTYTLCLYQKVTQKENGGSHASVSLGKGPGAA